MAPAGDMRWDEQAMSESFYLSNMIPQVGVGMNRGIWKDLEEKVRLWALKRGELYIYTGPIYTDGAKSKTIGSNKVGVPSFDVLKWYTVKSKDVVEYNECTYQPIGWGNLWSMKQETSPFKAGSSLMGRMSILFAILLSAKEYHIFSSFGFASWR